eukprot:8394272-Ditylum_brightwellii.AAC.1
MARTPKTAGTPGCYNAVSSPTPVTTPPHMIHTNKNSEIIAWRSGGPHGLKFKHMYEDGHFTNKTADQIKRETWAPVSQQKILIFFQARMA